MMIQNRKARFKYQILDTLEVGLVLKGTEVKSLREGKATLSEAYALIKEGELWLINAHIAPYSHGNIHNPDPTRTRKCLIGTGELRDLQVQVEQKGLVLVPLKLYFKKQWAKCQIGIGKPKKSFDRRADKKEQDLDRQAKQALKRKRS
jgi:SsrA-binding protein